MNFTPSVFAFLWAIIVGMGFKIGWGLIELLLNLLVASVNRSSSPSSSTTIQHSFAWPVIDQLLCYGVT